MACVFTVSGIARAGTRYVVTNDDTAFPFQTGVSFFTISDNGELTLDKQVRTGNYGIGGGFFGARRVVVLSNSKQNCVYASEASSGDVVGIDVSSLTITGRAQGSETDGGTSNGIGLAVHAPYLYASYTDSNTIGTFAVETGCGLEFVNDVSVSGLAGGTINGMATRGHMLIATYTDGTIESFDISGGTPVSNGDKQYSTATLNSLDATYPNSIDITSDGHYAIFGDTSTGVVVEVSDISSGRVTRTKVYSSLTSISASNIVLSPDETMLYVVHTQGASVSAMFFDKSTGTISPGCSSRVKGQSAIWSYLGEAVPARESGNGGGVYVAEFGTSSAMAYLKLSVSGSQCSLVQEKLSPFVDPNSFGLLSIASIPPRSF